MEQYFEALIAERRRQPADDLLSELIAVSDGSDRLTPGRGDLHGHPALRGRVRDHHEPHRQRSVGACCATPTSWPVCAASVGDPEAVQRAVEELLRWDSPVQLDGRMVLRDTEVAGQASQPGEQVMTLLGAANRDPRRFHDPESLDLARDEGPPMSFGSGIHYCLGAALARLEGQVCFGRLLIALQRRPTRRDAAVAHRDTITLRGLTRLPVELTSA